MTKYFIAITLCCIGGYILWFSSKLIDICNERQLWYSGLESPIAQLENVGKWVLVIGALSPTGLYLVERVLRL